MSGRTIRTAAAWLRSSAERDLMRGRARALAPFLKPWAARYCGATGGSNPMWRGSWRLSALPERRIERHAAVDQERRPGDVVGLVRGEPERGLRHVLRLADPAVRDQPQELGFGLGRLPGGPIDRRPDGAGCDRVHPDAVLGDLLGEALHHQHDATLGGRVIHVPGPGDDLMHRAHADDLAERLRNLRARAPAPELAHALAAAEELAGEVHVD